MNWFKRMFAKDQGEQMHEHNEGRVENKQQSDQYDMKTKMTYEYPKGPFRFPVIQDRERPESRAKQRQMTRKEVGGSVQKKRVVEDRSHAERQSTPAQVSRKIEPKNKRPFEPTHIPSPVYGYNKPATKIEESFEYELKDAFIELPKHQEHKEDSKRENMEMTVGLGECSELYESDNTPELNFPEMQGEIDPPEIIGNVIEKSDQSELKDHIHYNGDTNKENESPEPLSSFAKEPELIVEEEFNDLIVQNGMSTEDDAPQNLGSETPNDSLIALVDVQQEQVQLNSHDLEETSENEAVLDVNFSEGQPGLEEDRKTGISEVENDPFPADEVQPEQHCDQESGIYIEDASISSEEETNVDEESSPPPAKQRTHMPFNVLMLKEDKRKWELRQAQKSSQPKPEPSHQTEVAIAEQEVAATVQPTAGEEAYNDWTSYEHPSVELLYPPVQKEENKEWLKEQTELLDETLANFNVNAHVVHVSQGPSVTRFEVQPEPGVKVNKITNLSDDIKLSMAAKDIRIEAPIPGKRSVGIELPNDASRPVQLSEILGSPDFIEHESPLTAALGLDISGAPVVTDLKRMPHGLIAGATGSGKSVCINSILVSLLYKAKPEDVKLLLIDPKMVELAPYNHIPHLVSPVITDVKAATAALKWAVEEMERRYELFVHASVRDIGRFNEMAMKARRFNEKLPYIVIVIDELADLMMMAPADVEESICRIAQKARACGIHLIIATQRPSVDVITGLIKANVPTRIAFSVSSQVDSRTIIDIGGAERLLGRGDMLFLDSGSSKPVRLQGTYVSDEEIDRVIEHVRSQGEPDYLFEQEELLKKAQIQEDEDDLFYEACEFVIKQGGASTSLLQRNFRIGYNRAARLVFMLEERGIISEARGSKPRDVLIGENELEQLKASHSQT